MKYYVVVFNTILPSNNITITFKNVDDVGIKYLKNHMEKRRLFFNDTIINMEQVTYITIKEQEKVTDDVQA